jgi:hypothetical protein
MTTEDLGEVKRQSGGFEPFLRHPTSVLAVVYPLSLPNDRPERSAMTGATILSLTDEQLAAYPDGCPFEGANGHPQTPLLHYNAPAVMAARTDTDGEHFYAYYVCRGCWTGWWTSWGKRHQ